jgi:hypothetical protein
MMFLARVGIFEGGKECDESIRRWCRLFSRPKQASDVDIAAMTE